MLYGGEGYVVKYQDDGHSAGTRLQDMRQQTKAWQGGGGRGKANKALVLPLSFELGVLWIHLTSPSPSKGLQTEG